MNTYEVILFGIHMKVNRVAFTLGSFSIYWYGIIISLGFLLAMLYAFKRAKDFKLNVDKMIDVVLVSAPAAIIGARLYYVLFDADLKFKDFFNIRQGGLAIYGGIIFAFAAAYIMCRVRKLNPFALADVAALGFLIGQGIGRWGNFVNQEAFGSKTGSSWFGMISEQVIRDERISSGTLLTMSDRVHPCFLYESLWCIIGFVLLHIFSKKFRKCNGQVFSLYMAWYGFGRFFIEGLRTDSLMLGPIKVSQLVAVLLFVGGIALFLWLTKMVKEKSAEGGYQNLFGSEEDEDGDAETPDDIPEADADEDDDIVLPDVPEPTKEPQKSPPEDDLNIDLSDIPEVD